MTMKSQILGAVTCFGTFVNTFGSPILFFIVPKEHWFHSYLTTITTTILVGLLDLYNSDNAWKNFKIMQAAGFTIPQLLACGLHTMLATPLAGLILTVSLTGYNPEWEIIPLASSKYTSPTNVLFPALLMVLSTDVCFFMMHRLLHERLAHIHLLHHCCVYSSALTNVFFHPLDLAMEFTAPTAILWFTSNFVWKNPWMFTISYSVMQSWYALTHDEWLSLAHTQHHRSCATGYFVYIQHFYSDRDKECVRKLIPKQG